VDELLRSEDVTARDDSPTANTRFHVALAEVSGNLVLARVVTTLNERLAAEHQLVDPSHGADELAAGHDSIVDALGRRDGEGAAAAMRRHIELGRELLARQVRDVGIGRG
jgi:DNA-binding GntR family transcriptional regulator